MRTQSFIWKICFISLVLWTAQGCEYDELEFEYTDLETTSTPISDTIVPAEQAEMNESKTGNIPQDTEFPDTPELMDDDESDNCMIDGVTTNCPNTNSEIRRTHIIPPELEKYVNDPACKSEMIDLSIALDDVLTADDFRLSAEENAEFANIKDTFNLIFSYNNGKEYLNGMELTKELSDELTKLMDVRRNHVSLQQLKKKSAL